MAGLVNSIGDFEFLDLRGQVEVIKQETELLRRPGVPGVGLMLTGVRGKPFRLRSRVDAANLGDAEDAYANYLGCIGTGAYNVIQYDNNFGSAGFGFLVLDVLPIVLRRSLFTMGGLFPPSLAWLECDWMLCCVALDQSGGNE